MYEYTLEQEIELNWIDIYWNQKDYKPVHGSFLMANKTILNLET